MPRCDRDVPQDCIADHICPPLDGRPGSDGQWSAKCPAHDDSKRSLSISAGDRRRIIWQCWAGCSEIDVWRAMMATRMISPSCVPKPRAPSGATGADVQDDQRLAEIEKLLNDQPHPVDFMIRVAELLYDVDDRTAATMAGISQATYYRHRAKRRK